MLISSLTVDVRLQVFFEDYMPLLCWPRMLFEGWLPSLDAVSCSSRLHLYVAAAFVLYRSCILQLSFYSIWSPHSRAAGSQRAYWYVPVLGTGTGKAVLVPVLSTTTGTSTSTSTNTKY
jgi:hypothetical protein